MIFTIYRKAFEALMKQPARLWGISILSGILSFVFSLLFGFALGVGVCIGILLNVGMAMVYLHGYRGEGVHTIQLFDPFGSLESVKRTLCGMGWKMLWSYIWLLIPIAGPVIFIYKSRKKIPPLSARPIPAEQPSEIQCIILCYLSYFVHTLASFVDIC